MRSYLLVRLPSGCDRRLYDTKGRPYWGLQALADRLRKRGRYLRVAIQTEGRG